jgi:hypothetical protein
VETLEHDQCFHAVRFERLTRAKSLNGFLGELIEATGGNIGFELLIPHLRIKLLIPGAQFRLCLGRQLCDGNLIRSLMLPQRAHQPCRCPAGHQQPSELHVQPGRLPLYRLERQWLALGGDDSHQPDRRGQRGRADQREPRRDTQRHRDHQRGLGAADQRIVLDICAGMAEQHRQRAFADLKI